MIRQIRPWKKCPIAFDFEYDSINYARKNGVNAAKRLVTDMAIAFLKAVDWLAVSQNFVAPPLMPFYNRSFRADPE